MRPQLQLACASHTPLMAFTDPAGGRAEVDAALRRLGERIEAFDPELVFQFSPDHYNGFFYDLMPPFCLGVQASAVGDWQTHSGPLKVPEDIALGAHAAAAEAGVDLAVSYRMLVDHGFTQFWQITVGSAERYPIVPIFINCAAPPLPAFSRVRALGEAIGRYAAGLGKRVLFVGSGGLSHDPPLPQIATADAQRREFLIAGRNPGPEARAARQERILAAGRASAKGEGPCQPLESGVGPARPRALRKTGPEDVRSLHRRRSQTGWAAPAARRSAPGRRRSPPWRAPDVMRRKSSSTGRSRSGSSAWASCMRI